MGGRASTTETNLKLLYWSCKHYWNKSEAIILRQTQYILYFIKSM